MRNIIVESPFAGRYVASPIAAYSSALYIEERVIRRFDAENNLDYIKALCRYIALRGEIPEDNPFASHLFCTQFLEDKVQEERERGIEIGLSWGVYAQLTVVGYDRGISTGMRRGIERARLERRPIEWLSLGSFRDSWLPPGIKRDEWREFYQQGDAMTQVHD